MPASKQASSLQQTVDAESHGALTQLRALLSQQDYVPGRRLPSERSLCETLGVTRNALRKALATLEAEGQIWRHVGRGTFVGPNHNAITDDSRLLASQTSPANVMEARLTIEPELARLAALHATIGDIEQMLLCTKRSQAASDWRVYETWDNQLHRAIAEATHNSLLIALFDTLNTVRRTVVWGRLRPRSRSCPGPDHHSHADHLAIVQAIQDRDMDAARINMRSHLETVHRKLLDDSSVS